MIKSILEDVSGLSANTMPFSRKDLGICTFGVCVGAGTKLPLKDNRIYSAN